MRKPRSFPARGPNLPGTCEGASAQFCRAPSRLAKADLGAGDRRIVDEQSWIAVEYWKDIDQQRNAPLPARLDLLSTGFESAEIDGLLASDDEVPPGGDLLYTDGFGSS